MSTSSVQPADGPRVPALAVINPSGNRTRMPLDRLPFLIGRQGDNHLVLRDNRASRNHARIFTENGEYYIEDLNSRHGVHVNGVRVNRHRLADSDRIDFGFQDSYRLIFNLEEGEIHRIMEQFQQGAGANNLAKLRSLVEVARALQSSLSTNDVLAAVVDAALSVTGAERGFLLLRKEEELEVTVARDQRGIPLVSSDLSVPRSLIHRALSTRRELLSMTFDPLGQEGVRPEMSVADLELRSVVCVPLVHVRTGAASLQETIATSVNDTVGVLYMDSRGTAADLSSGNREILQTLALEASTILENARLLQEEREKQRLEEELNVARAIQQDLLPAGLPSDGWFRAAGSSVTSRQVGGDYYDVRHIDADTFACAIADVSGKGVSAALLAALLQGAFLFASEGPAEIPDVMTRMNRFLYERAKGEKYATLFYCTLARSGQLCWSNAGHPKPILVRGSELIHLESTGLPLGMMDAATYEMEKVHLLSGDKIVMYSDGLSEAENSEGEFFDKKGFPETLRANAALGCVELQAKLVEAVQDFSEGAELSDDITTLVLEYRL